jgi:hypothetical protein
LDFAIDESDDAFFIDVKSPAPGILTRVVQNPESCGHFLLGVGENRVVGVQGFGKFLVRFRIVNAGCKKGDTELADFLTAVTQRFAL